MKLNTIQVVHKYLPTLCEESMLVYNYTNLLNKNYGVSIIAAPIIKNYEDKTSFRVVRIKDNHLKKLLNNKGFDLIHIHSYIYGELALEMARKNQVPIVATFYPQEFYAIKEKNRNKMMKKIVQIYNYYNYLFTTNQRMINILKDYGYKGKISLIKSGTDISYDDSNRLRDKDYIERIHNVSDDSYILLYVGSLNWNKNLKLILETIAHLRDFKQKFKILFVGEGNARIEMNRFIEENKFSKYVDFVGEITDRSQLVKYYAQASLLLYPVPYLTSGLAIREAAACSCPTLALKDVDTLINDNINGYLSDNNSLSYAQRIISAINDRNKDKVKLAAQETLAIPYEQVVKELYEYYVEIINNS
ncbi:MAG TPA: glycosyltransferase [Haloplasmataceae bacterium]